MTIPAQRAKEPLGRNSVAMWGRTCLLRKPFSEMQAVGRDEGLAGPCTTANEPFKLVAEQLPGRGVTRVGYCCATSPGD